MIFSICRFFAPSDSRFSNIVQTIHQCKAIYSADAYISISKNWPLWLVMCSRVTHDDWSWSWWFCCVENSLTFTPSWVWLWGDARILAPAPWPPAARCCIWERTASRREEEERWARGSCWCSAGQWRRGPDRGSWEPMEEPIRRASSTERVPDPAEPRRHGSETRRVPCPYGPTRSESTIS